MLRSTIDEAPRSAHDEAWIPQSQRCVPPWRGVGFHNRKVRSAMARRGIPNCEAPAFRRGVDSTIARRPFPPWRGPIQRPLLSLPDKAELFGLIGKPGRGAYPRQAAPGASIPGAAAPRCLNSRGSRPPTPQPPGQPPPLGGPNSRDSPPLDATTPLPLPLRSPSISSSPCDPRASPPPPAIPQPPPLLRSSRPSPTRTPSQPCHTYVKVGPKRW